MKKGLTILTKDELLQMGVIPLAVLCGKLADDSTTEETIADQARKLKQEWALLQIPMPIEYKVKNELEAKEAALRTRMIEFLHRAAL